MAEDAKILEDLAVTGFMPVEKGSGMHELSEEQKKSLEQWKEVFDQQRELIVTSRDMVGVQMLLQSALSLRLGMQTNALGGMDLPYGTSHHDSQIDMLTKVLSDSRLSADVVRTAMFTAPNTNIVGGDRSVGIEGVLNNILKDAEVYESVPGQRGATVYRDRVNSIVSLRNLAMQKAFPSVAPEANVS